MNNDEAEERNKTDDRRDWRDERGRFLPGNNANPEGRPRKELSLTSIAKAMLEAHPEMAQEIAKKWLEQSKSGVTEARRDLQDRIEGRVALPIQAKVEIQGEVNWIIGKGYDRTDRTES